MRWTTRMWWISAGLLSAAGCGRADREPVEPDTSDAAATVEASIDRPFTLRVGQSATIPGTGVSVTFHGVPEDSRCPIDVTCVWAGNARLDLTGFDNGTRRAFQINTTTEPRVARIGDLRLEIVELKPEPNSNTSIPPDSYRATLKVTRPA